MTDSRNRDRDNDLLHKTQSADLGLLEALDALLWEESVAAAARKLGASAAAVSRALGRLRRTLGDPLLVRAGNRLVPTPRAEAMKGPVREIVGRARALLAPEGAATPEQLARTYTIRSGEWFAETFGSRLLVEIMRRAPGAALRFLPEGDEDVEPLRLGSIDLDVGVIGHTAPEVVTRPLFECRLFGVVSRDHPLAAGEVTAERYAAYDHVSVSRRGRARGPIDQALAGLGLARRIAAVAPSFATALRLVLEAGLVGVTPRRTRDEDEPAEGVVLFPIPVPTPPIVMEAAWHPRAANDPTHRWLRGLVHEVCGRRG